MWATRSRTTMIRSTSKSSSCFSSPIATSPPIRMRSWKRAASAAPITASCTFVDREPGMTVADLLDTLKITKQSLARVLKQLIDSGYIRQVTGPEDRRQRMLYTDRGRPGACPCACRATVPPHSRCIGKDGSRRARNRQALPCLHEERRRGLKCRKPAIGGRRGKARHDNKSDSLRRCGRIYWSSTMTGVSAICSTAIWSNRVFASRPPPTPTKRDASWSVSISTC